MAYVPLYEMTKIERGTHHWLFGREINCAIVLVWIYAFMLDIQWNMNNNVIFVMVPTICDIYGSFIYLSVKFVHIRELELYSW